MLLRVGLLGDGAQAAELEDYARDEEVAFRAVFPEFISLGSATIDVHTTDIDLIETPVTVAVGAPGLKRDLVHAWGGRTFHTIVGAGAFISPTASIGPGSTIAPNATITRNVRIGAHVLVNVGSTISHDSTIGDFATVSPGVNIGGRCRVGDGVFIGIGATISHGVTIAHGAVIGAGAVVTNDLTRRGVYIGVPARLQRETGEWLRVI